MNSEIGSLDAQGVMSELFIRSLGSTSPDMNERENPFRGKIGFSNNDNSNLKKVKRLLTRVSRFWIPKVTIASKLW